VSLKTVFDSAKTVAPGNGKADIEKFYAAQEAIRTDRRHLAGWLVEQADLLEKDHGACAIAPAYRHLAERLTEGFK